MNPKILFILAALAALSGCQAVATRNAKAQADLEAGRIAAQQGRATALAAMEAVKGIKPSH